MSKLWFFTQDIVIPPCILKNYSCYWGYTAITGWANDYLNTYSTETSPCDVEIYIASLPQGAGYYSDPDKQDGWCKTITAANLTAVRAQVNTNDWVDDNTGVTYLPPRNFHFKLGRNSTPPPPPKKINKFKIQLYLYMRLENNAEQFLLIMSQSARRKQRGLQSGQGR